MAESLPLIFSSTVLKRQSDLLYRKRPTVKVTKGNVRREQLGAESTAINL